MATLNNDDKKFSNDLDEREVRGVDHVRSEHQEIVQRYEDSSERKRVLRKV
jgi:hypothetical protein